MSVKIDFDGNPFQVGAVYDYLNHPLELMKMDEDERGGIFRLLEDTGSLRKGWMGNLSFEKSFKFLRHGSSFKTNKGASVLLSKHW